MGPTEEFDRTATRQRFLIVALLCALAIGLTGVYSLRSQSAPPITVTKPFVFDHEVPGPDSSAYVPKPHVVQDPGSH